MRFSGFARDRAILRVGEAVLLLEEWVGVWFTSEPGTRVLKAFSDAKGVLGYMVQENGGSSGLVKLEDFEGELEEHWQDVQGRKVLDRNGDEIGTVEDLYVYEAAAAVHTLKVEVEERHVLVPVDAVTNVSEDGVEVEQSKDTILESPEFDSEEVPDPETRRAAYEHYGYPDQLDLGGG